MNNVWSLVPLGEIIRHRKEFIQISDFEIYKRCRVQLHAKGIVLRDTVAGSEIKTKEQQVCRAGEFLVAEIDAKVGGFGVVPDELDGSIVSSHYFLFQINGEKLDPHFLDYFVRTPFFRDQVTARGSTNYAAIRAHHVLQYEIPLPPLSEQRRIVARIKELVAKIEEAQELRRQGVEEIKALVRSLVSALCRSSSRAVPIGEIIGADSLRNGKSVRPSEIGDSIRCLTLSSMREGRVDSTCTKAVPLTSAEAQPFLVRRGDVFIVRGNGSKELCGLAGYVEEEKAGVIFPDLFIKVPLPAEQVLPEFFVAIWNSTATREVIEEKAKTTSGIWKINQGHILSTSIPIPPIPEQRRVVAQLDVVQGKVGTLKQLQAETDAELDAILPSILDRAFKGDLL